MRRLPPPHPRGAPKTPGSGRRRGTPNRRTTELKALMHALAHDRAYQDQLRRDFCRRKIHPTTEVAIWNRVLGPQTQAITVGADLTLDARLAKECELFSRLSVEQLEQLARESEALVNRARAMLQEQRVLPVEITLPVAPASSGENIQPGEKPHGTDVDDA